MPIYRKGSEYSDRDNGGANLADAIERLVPVKRGKGRLKSAPERDAIGESVAEAVPAGADPNSSGITSPLVEQAYTGATYYNLTSSDGLFVFEFGHETDYVDNDGAGDTFTIKHIDPDA